MTLLAAAIDDGGSGGDPLFTSKCYDAFRNDWFCWQYVADRRQELVDATAQHVQITLLSVALGLLIAFPVALLARRSARMESAALGVATGIYTIPSLALFPLLVPFTGLSLSTVVIGLALYALTVLVRAIVDGLRAVPDDVRESAVGLGYGPMRLLLRVELPLALPTIVAGVRVATVSTVALTTVGSLVAYGGLGNLIRDGVRTNFRAELVSAAVLCVVIAVLFDIVLVLVQRWLTPWARKGAAT
ncbi:ABC transporter permease [Nocardioides sp. MH1]|uniref:ABC transporter permease n=1 Tax=Nocardioides sp. MH1 TaxID=3242490 RepID=UPI0035212FC4